MAVIMEFYQIKWKIQSNLTVFFAKQFIKFQKYGIQKYINKSVHTFNKC